MLRAFEMFAGYGGASFALKKAGIPFECVGYSEIDKYAIQCYEQNHKGVKNFGDATKINPDKLPDFDLLTGGFPCQPFSNAGLCLGELDTRGTLFNDIVRIAAAKKPKYMLLENVKGLTTKRHKETFDKIIAELKRIGYLVDVRVLNSKDYGVPQNRERVFFVCRRKVDEIQGDINIFKVWDYKWPEKEDLKVFLKDVLEDAIPKEWENRIEDLSLKSNPSDEELDELHSLLNERYLRRVDEKFYLSDEQYKKLIYEEIEEGKESKPMIIQLNNPTHSNNRVYSVNGISPTLRTLSGGNQQPFIRVKNATLKGYIEGYSGDGVNLEHPNSKTRRGRIQKNVIGCLQTNDQRGVITEDLRIRKLTPTECFRLMGFLNDDIDLSGISNSQRYKLAGNGWDVNLVSKIFKNLIQEGKDEN